MMTGVVEHPDQLTVGAYITVVGWRKKKKVERRTHIWMFSTFGGDTDDEAVQYAERTDLVGCVLRVIGISFPFVAIEGGDPFVYIDLRDAAVSLLSPSYVKAFRRRRSRKKKSGAATPASPFTSRVLSEQLKRMLEAGIKGPMSDPEDEDEDDEE